MLLEVSAPINWINFSASIGSVLVSILLIFFNYKSTKKTINATILNSSNAIAASTKNIEITLNSKRIEERKNEIYKALNELYGPFSQLRQKSNLLYEKFKINKAANSPTGKFSTLLYLLEKGGPQELDPNDQVLLAEIIKIGRLCERLIQSKAGLIDDENLRTIWFPAAAKHYLIIRLAYNGSLKGALELYQDSTFPDGISDLIEKRITALKNELEDLNKIK